MFASVNRHPPRQSGLVVWLIAITFAGGCASPGPPRAPSLHLPLVVTDLHADRIGDEVRLAWTSPSKTTDKELIRSGMVAIVCREDGLPTQKAKPPACNPIDRLAVAPGPSHAVERLYGAQLADPPRLMGYRVELLSAQGGSAGVSEVAYTSSGKAPASVEGLRAKALREGVELSWERGDFPVAISRRLIAGPDGKPPATKSNSSSDTAKVELRAGSPSASDTGGLVDKDAAHSLLNTYEYSAWRVRTIMGLGDRPLEIISPRSAAITYKVQDIFPPQTPTGLTSIPGLPGTNSVDLSWQPVGDPDLAGYIVYRRAGDAGAWVRLTAAPVRETAYSDTTVSPGTVYRYRVTAVDQSGNESSPSGEVQEPSAQ